MSARVLLQPSAPDGVYVWSDEFGDISGSPGGVDAVAPGAYIGVAGTVVTIGGVTAYTSTVTVTNNGIRSVQTAGQPASGITIDSSVGDVTASLSLVAGTGISIENLPGSSTGLVISQTPAGALAPVPGYGIQYSPASTEQIIGWHTSVLFGDISTQWYYTPPGGSEIQVDMKLPTDLWVPGEVWRCDFSWQLESNSADEDSYLCLINKGSGYQSPKFAYIPAQIQTDLKEYPFYGFSGSLIFEVQSNPDHVFDGVALVNANGKSGSTQVLLRNCVFTRLSVV